MKRLALFAHYDANDEIKRYVVHLLGALQGICDEVVFISTAALSGHELGKVRHLARRTLLVDNKGFDFGMWQQGLGEVDLTSLDELILCNSSVFGPITPLSVCFKSMRAVACDFWSMTDNVELAPHLQSYFLVFRRSVLRSGYLEPFFSSVLPYRNKDQVIRSYEVGLTTFLVEHGFVPAALVPLATLGTKGGQPPKANRRNPTCYHAARLLELGMPFVKLELLRDNPGGVLLEPIYDRMREAGFDTTMIEFDRPAKRRQPVLAKLIHSVRRIGRNPRSVAGNPRSR
jgi:lipopolysaccharide biosynthesis protein